MPHRAGRTVTEFGALYIWRHFAGDTSRHFGDASATLGDAWRRSATLGDAWRRFGPLATRGAAPRHFGDSLATVWRHFGDAWRRLATLGQTSTTPGASAGYAQPQLDPAEPRSGRGSIQSKVAVATNLQLPPGSCKTAGLQALAKHYVVMAISLSGCLIITIVFGQRPSRQKRGARFVDRTMVVDDVSTNGCLALRS